MAEPYAIGVAKAAGEQAANSIIDNTLGMAMQPLKNKMQLKQQKKLQNLQIQGTKELSDYQQKQQLAMWEATNYKAQMEQLKKAGLNPGLIYGMGGGGGATTGASTQTGVTAGTAQIPANAGMAMMTATQMDNIKAQTEYTRAQTEKLIGPDTKKTEAEINELNTRIENLKSETESTKAKTALTNVQTNVAEIQLIKENETLNAYIERTNNEAKEAKYNMEIAGWNAKVKRSTYQTEIDKAKTELQQTRLQNALIIATTQNTKTDTKVKESQISVNIAQKHLLNKQYSAITQGIMQAWEKLKNESTDVQTREILSEIEAQKLNINPKDIIQIIGILKDM